MNLGWNFQVDTNAQLDMEIKKAKDLPDLSQ